MKKSKRLLALLCACVLCLSSFFVQVVEAADKNVNARAITSGQIVTVTQKARVNGAGNGYFTVAGASSYGYCAQNKSTYWSNEVSKQGTAREWNDAEARKALYYGPGGPGYAGPYYGSLGSDMDYVTFAVGQLNGDTNNNTKAYAYREFLSDKEDPSTKGYKAYIADIPSPYQDVAFLYYVPLKGTLSLVKTSSLNINEDAISYYSLEGAVYDVYSDSSCSTQVGTLTTDIYGKSNSIELDAGTYYVKERSAPKGYQCNSTVYTVKVSAGGSNSISVSDIPLSILKIRKSSANPDVTQGNQCYSLEGAEYGVFIDDACTQLLQTVTTDESGRSEPIYMPEGTYYVKEMKAPKGFVLNEQIETIWVSNGDITHLDVVDVPQVDPIGLLLKKEDIEDTSISLEGAEFVVKYYDVLLADKNRDPLLEQYVPRRTWVLQTDENGVCEFDTSNMISGDEFYYTLEGEAALPIGTITIQETKAPEGYRINPEIFVRQITPGGDGERLDTYNAPIVMEELLCIRVKKRTWSNNDYLYFAEFTHVKPDGTMEVLEITREEGCVEFKGLTPGIHRIYESKAPNGFKPNPQEVQIYVSEDSKMAVLNKDKLDESIVIDEDLELGMIHGVEFWDEMYPLQIKVNKVNHSGVFLDGATFTLSDEDGNLLETKTTKEGILIFENLKLDAIYYLEETKAPDGYKLPIGKDNEKTHVYEISFFLDFGELCVCVKCPNNLLWDDIEYGELFLVPGETQKIASFDVKNEKNTLSLCIVNELGEGFFLPQTGASGSILCIIIGSIVFLGGMHFKLYRKQEKKVRKKFMKYRLFRKVAAFCAAVAIMTSGFGENATVHAETRNVEKGVVDFGRGEAQIVINGNEGQTLQGKTFCVYKLFEAENSADLESINYTFNEEYREVLQDIVGDRINQNAEQVTEYEVLDYIQSLNDNENEFRYFIEELRDAIGKTRTTGDEVIVNSVTEDNIVILEGLEFGYYIIDEVTAVAGTNQAASLCIVNTANPNAVVAVKSDFPTVTKKIQEDDNQSAIGIKKDGWNDIGDYEIGQRVPYKFESIVPNMSGYDAYYYAWHDVMDESLTFLKETLCVKIIDSMGENAYMLSTNEFTIKDNLDNGETFIIEVQDLKEIVEREFENKGYGQKVVVTYEATLNDKAAKYTGRKGFENDVRLEFSNNPDSDGMGQTGFTPWDTVVCFTYQLDLLKTNNKDMKLEGAKFRLYSDEECENEVYVKTTEDGYNVVNRDSVEKLELDHAVEMESDAEGTILVNGLDSGIYYLKETKAPTGYRKIQDPIVITVSPTFTEERDSYVKGDGGTNKTLVELSATAHIRTFLNGVYTDKDATLVTNVETGKINVTVVNTMGSKLPVTGSVATVVMLTVGVGVVVVCLFGRKKYEKNH